MILREHRCNVCQILIFLRVDVVSHNGHYLVLLDLVDEESIQKIVLAAQPRK